MTLPTLRELAAHAYQAGNDAKEKRSTEGARDWLNALAVFLRAAALEADAPGQLDIRMGFSRASVILGELATGALPDYINDAIGGQGRPHDPPMKRDAKSRAAIYRQACTPEGFPFGGEVHHIKDKAPIKTLAALFGTSKDKMGVWANAKNIDPLTFGPMSPEIIIQHAERAGRMERSVTAEVHRRKRAGSGE